jgi:AcrR family transcriptional regulator
MHATAQDVRGRADTRARLLEAAAAVIARDGYEKATLASIAERAGLTTGAVYSTYGSKWELLRAVVADRTHALSLAALPGTAAPDDELDRVATELADAVGHEAARELVILQLEVHLLALRHPELRDDLVAFGRDHRSRLAEQVSVRAGADGAGVPLPPEQLATVLSAAVQGLQLTQLFYPDAVPASLYSYALRRLLSPDTT